MDNSQLNILAVIGFKGVVLDGLILHPDNEHIIYPLGSQIVIRNVLTREQRFLRVKYYFLNLLILQGHNNDITVITVTSSGKYLASGQKTFIGFKVI